VDDFTVDVDETAGEVLDGMNREGRGGAAAAAMNRPMTPQQPQRW